MTMTCCSWTKSDAMMCVVSCVVCDDINDGGENQVRVLIPNQLWWGYNIYKYMTNSMVVVRKERVVFCNQYRWFVVKKSL